MQQPTIEQRIRNMDGMRETELKQLLADFKEASIPQWRRYLLMGYNVAGCATLMYFTVNCKKYNQRYLQNNRNRSLYRLAAIATAQAFSFCAVYCLGFLAVSGIYNPVGYLKTYSHIQAKIAGNTLRHDRSLQKNVLIQTMRSFGLSQQLIKKAEEELQASKKKILESGELSEESVKILKGEDKSVWSRLLGFDANKQ